MINLIKEAVTVSTLKREYIDKYCKYDCHRIANVLNGTIFFHSQDEKFLKEVAEEAKAILTNNKKMIDLLLSLNELTDMESKILFECKQVDIILNNGIRRLPLTIVESITRRKNN